MPGVFKEHNVMELEKQAQLQQDNDQSEKGPMVTDLGRPDFLPLVILLINFFVFSYNFVLFET